MKTQLDNIDKKSLHEILVELDIDSDFNYNTLWAWAKYFAQTAVIKEET